MGIDIGKIVREWLRRNGAAGLVNTDLECACTLDNLYPCGEPNIDCTAGVLTDRDGCGNCSDESPCDYHLKPMHARRLFADPVRAADVREMALDDPDGLGVLL